MYQRWLDTLCASLPRARFGVVYPLDTGGAGAAPLASWPAHAEPDGAWHQQADLLAAGAGDVVSRSADAGGVTTLTLARRLVRCDQPTGLVLQIEAGADQQAVLTRLLDWAETWLPLDTGDSDSAAALALGDDDPVNVLLRAQDVDAGLASAATLLRARFDQERVFVLCLQPASRVRAISDNVRFDTRSALLAELSNAVTPLADGSAATTIDNSLQAIRKQHSLGRLSAVVMSSAHSTTPVGVLVFEARSTDPASRSCADDARQIAATLGAALDLRERLDHGVMARVRSEMRRRLSGLIGPRLLPLKLFTLAVAIAIPVTAAIPVTYEVVAPATLEGRVQRAIVAPFAGFVGSQLARAGDQVTAGQLLAELDPRELRLEHGQLQAELDATDRQYRQALAARNQADARLFSAEVEQLQARIDLLDARLARTRLVAPINGIIISGDLSRSLGAPVTRGEVLFEIAPINDYRLAIAVPEAGVVDVRPGHAGELVIRSATGSRHRFEVRHIGAAADADSGASYRVEAALVGANTAGLRPGMTGTARIDAGQRSLLWLATHDVLDWLRLLWWRWLP